MGEVSVDGVPRSNLLGLWAECHRLCLQPSVNIKAPLEVTSSLLSLIQLMTLKTHSIIQVLVFNKVSVFVPTSDNKCNYNGYLMIYFCSVCCFFPFVLLTRALSICN